jgi:hypothetical protein
MANPTPSFAPQDERVADRAREADAVAFASQLRRERLAPYFEEFLRWAEEELDPKEIPRAVPLGAHSVEIGSWERTTLREAHEPEGSDEVRVPSLLAEGVALQVRLKELLHRFDHGPLPRPAQLQDFLDGLVTDLAVGIAVQEELQWDMNRLIGRGELADAKCVSAFRSKIVQCVSELKERLGPDEVEEAERRAERLSPDRPRETSTAPPALEEEQPGVPTWATYGDSEQDGEAPPEPAQEPAEAAPGEPMQAEPRGLNRPLLLLLFAVLAVYAVVMVPRLKTRELPVLTLEQFSHLEVVRGVTARPPSLFVDLDRQRWQAATPTERHEMLREMGRIAGEAGYNGIHARTRNGVPVGQWLKKTGVKLHQRPLDAT